MNSALLATASMQKWHFDATPWVNGSCRLTVDSSLHCFGQVVFGCAMDVVKNSCCKVIFPLTVQNIWCTGAGVEVALQKCISCFTWTICTGSLGPPGLCNTPNIPCTRIFTKPWQMLLQPKLFSSFLINPVQPHCRNEPHVWVQFLKIHLKGRSGPYVIWRTSACWRRESSCPALQPCQLFLEQLSITQPGSHTGHRSLLVLMKR